NDVMSEKPAREPESQDVLEQDSGVDAIASALSVAGPGADHAFLAAELVTLARGFIERVRNVRLDRIAMGPAGVGHVDRKRRAGVLHRDRRAVPAALLECGRACSAFRRKVKGLSVSAAFSHRKSASGPA